MTNKFTPGPWRIATSGNYGNSIEGQSGRSRYEGDSGFRSVGAFQACESTGLYKEEEENKMANGRLMAAAPELLAALQGVLRVADRATDEFDAARAAIQKATGEPV
jgi:hypothetical protein